MKTILKMLSLFLLISFTFLSADNNTSTPQFNIEGQIILNTISKLENKGYITQKNATEAKKEFVFDNKNLTQEIKPSLTAVNEVTWTEYLNLINFMKLFAMLGFLYVFKGIIMNFIYVFYSVPAAVYQLMLIVFSLTLTFFSNDLWASQSFYLSNFGVVANIFVLTWVVFSHDEFFEKIFKLFSLNIPVHISIGFYLMVYFGFFAIHLDSSFLGILSLIGFSAMFTFIMGSTGLSTFIGYEEEDYMNISLFVNGIILLAYSYISINNIPVPYLETFSIGIEYICSLAFTIALLINSSFFSSSDRGFIFAVILMFISFGLSITGIYLFDMTIIPVIFNTGFFLFILGWIGYLGFQLNVLFTVTLLSSLLYGIALLIEARPELFVTSLF